MAASKYPELDAAIKRAHPNGVPESVAIVAMGYSSTFYMTMVCTKGDRRREFDETWAINAQGTCIQHDLLFHMDDCKVQERRAEAQPEGMVAGMTNWLKDHPNFITSKAYPDYPGAIEMPIDDVVNKLQTLYFNSTVAYAVGWAMAIGVKTISMYGCDYSRENSHQVESGRACVEYLLAIASSQGIKVQIAPQSALMDGNIPDNRRLYGYDGYQIKIEPGKGDRKVKIIKESCELPTAEEIEKRYTKNHNLNSTIDIQM